MRLLTQEELEMVSGASLPSRYVNIYTEGQTFYQYQEYGTYRYGNEGQYTATGWHNATPPEGAAY